MTITSITVGIKRLVAGPIGGLGKFENVSFECQVTSSVEQGDNVHAVYDASVAFCRTKINAELDRLEGKVTVTKPEEDYIPDFKPGKFAYDNSEKDKGAK